MGDLKSTLREKKENIFAVGSTSTILTPHENLMNTFDRETVKQMEGLVSKVNFKCTSTQYRQSLS